ncbi:hypothetical protein [Paenibacillus gorillae]|uniref:hypothetical protein n=1 Tax=Paenibacillus gorillae TaxID=1243662 RepID=UPI0004B92E67|nr:hypothetical protein [Paenibacillus gorillae]
MNLNKRDHFYIFVIMLMVFSAVTLCTIVFYNSEKAVMGISVASTLISIVLAVLAIAYTFMDSMSSKKPYS